MTTESTDLLEGSQRTPEPPASSRKILVGTAIVYEADSSSMFHEGRSRLWTWTTLTTQAFEFVVESGIQHAAGSSTRRPSTGSRSRTCGASSSRTASTLGAGPSMSPLGPPTLSQDES